MSSTTFRPLRRFRQAAPAELCVQVLSSSPRGTLCVIGENGYPYGIPINFLFHEGKIYFHCAKEGHKLDAIRSNGKVSFTVLSEGHKNEGEWWYNFTSVVCFGRIAEVLDKEKTYGILRLLAAKYFPEGYDLEKDMRKNAPNALILEMTIDHMSGKNVREK